MEYKEQHQSSKFALYNQCAAGVDCAGDQKLQQ